MSELNDERHEAFLRLYSVNEPGLRAFVRSLLPTRDDAREVMQEVAVVLWKKFSELPTDDDFSRWAFGVARTQVLSYTRDKARDRHLFSDELIQTLAEESTSRSAREEDRRDALEGCLQKLPSDRRELVLAAYAPGVKIDELAQRRGQSAMALYKILHRIRLALVDCVQQTMCKEGLA